MVNHHGSFEPQRGDGVNARELKDDPTAHPSSSISRPLSLSLSLSSTPCRRHLYLARLFPNCGSDGGCGIGRGSQPHSNHTPTARLTVFFFILPRPFPPNGDGLDFHPVRYNIGGVLHHNQALITLPGNSQIGLWMLEGAAVPVLQDGIRWLRGAREREREGEGMEQLWGAGASWGRRVMEARHLGSFGLEDGGNGGNGGNGGSGGDAGVVVRGRVEGPVGE